MTAERAHVATETEGGAAADPDPVDSPGRGRPGGTLAASSDGPAAPEGAPAPAPCRAVIEHIVPRVEGGSFAAKTSLGEAVLVEADVFADGPDLLACELRSRHELDHRWTTASMVPLGNDRWRGRFTPARLGRHQFQIRATIDHFSTWRRDLLARADAGQDHTAELEVGAEVVEGCADRASGEDRRTLAAVAGQLRRAVRGLESDVGGGLALEAGPSLRDLVTSPALSELTRASLDWARAAVSQTLWVVADPARARFSTWYELFPRSAAGDGRRHGTFADVEALLPYLLRLGVDTLYLPPIHPIGVTNRKGRDGAPRAGPEDPGSPWAIGSAEGGHTSVHPRLGTLGDFEHLLAAAAVVDIDVAIDLAFQCSPDHPWVAEHPQWFRRLPDGTIRFAENPPKRYEDIYPLDFDTDDWRSLWSALLGVVRFWIDHGVGTFRVDNPHTKPLRFWEWLIATVKAEHPEVIFLSEAFTRPKPMERLAKAGFSQSYTYFAWRNEKWELEQYLGELTRREVLDRFRASFWPNTPDILTEVLQRGGTPTFLLRLVLAATMSANYGIYGPAYELQEHVPRSPGSEEYLHSEKYEIRRWDLERPDSLAEFVARVNRIRRQHPALQYDRTFRLHGVDNDALIAYSKTVGAGDPADTAVGSGVTDAVVVVANLDPRHVQSGWVDLDLGALGLATDRPFVAHDLLTDAHYTWDGPRNFVILDPDVVPAHVLALRHPGPPRT